MESDTFSPIFVGNPRILRSSSRRNICYQDHVTRFGWDEDGILCGGGKFGSLLQSVLSKPHSGTRHRGPQTLCVLTESGLLRISTFRSSRTGRCLISLFWVTVPRRENNCPPGTLLPWVSVRYSFPCDGTFWWTSHFDGPSSREIGPQGSSS